MLDASQDSVTDVAQSVTAVVVNFRTEALTRRCVETLVAAYPTLPLVLVDNGSGDASADYIRHLVSTREHVRAVFNERNRYHGPALDQGVRAVTTPFALTVDSDAEILGPGFIELMLAAFGDTDVYAVGELRLKSRYGYTFGYHGDPAPRRRLSIPYAHPWAMVLDRRKYLELPPFAHHGAPCLANMRGAQRAGYRVVDFPVTDYLVHHERGTSSRQGYGRRLRVRQIIERRLEAIEALVQRERTLDVTPPPDRR